MLVTHDPRDADRPIDSALLLHIGESIRLAVHYRKDLSRISQSTAIVDARIRTLRQVVQQIQTLQNLHRHPRAEEGELDIAKMSSLVVVTNELLRWSVSDDSVDQPKGGT